MTTQDRRPPTAEDLKLMHEPFDEETERAMRMEFSPEDLPGARWLMRKAQAIIDDNRRKRAH